MISDVRKDGRFAERGTSLVGYTLVLALFTSVALGVMGGLERTSTEYLDATGETIGDARPTKDELKGSLVDDGSGTAPTPPPPPPPPPTYTWTDNYTGVIGGGSGLCLGASGGGIVQTACSSSSSQSATFYDNTDDTDDHVQVRVDGLCMTHMGEGQATTLATCVDGNEAQLWLPTPSGNMANAGEPGQCLDIESSQAQTSGAVVGSEACHGGPNQTFSTPGPYVPPITAVLSVDASNASSSTGVFNPITGNELNSDNGDGSSYDSPGTSIGSATLDFAVETAGNYKISGVVKAPNGQDNSFWISIDGQNFKWGFPATGGWTTDWVNATNDEGSSGGGDVVIWLEPGDYPLTVSVREDGASLQSLTLVLQ